ncbi:MarR family winged helix-turn-helix transcriptional regulator [Clostridium sp. C105KSO13]|uniref:MarR family winged helix-turn-helix transcriptional regulator n=1 Tax=Clostridium sp. C105KSO13 TaxID=1776045 RepID=UPI0007407551|nr:MarR family transcriptional regulator [Clostridium sp. C105KSO13]CUX15673.1 putative HTH-type transcriptional regulator YusO [Clostridium sp. C105KSO13]
MDENTIIHKILDIFAYKNEYQLRTSNIQPQDMYVLERIYFNKKMAIKDLSKQYSIPPSTLTGIIDRLEKKKLIERLRTNIDRRSIELVATPEGKTAVEKHMKEDKLFSNNFFNTLEQEKKEKLKELLEELLNNVKKDSLFSLDNE